MGSQARAGRPVCRNAARHRGAALARAAFDYARRLLSGIHRLVLVLGSRSLVVDTFRLERTSLRFPASFRPRERHRAAGWAAAR